MESLVNVPLASELGEIVFAIGTLANELDAISDELDYLDMDDLADDLWNVIENNRDLLRYRNLGGFFSHPLRQALDDTTKTS